MLLCPSSHRSAVCLVHWRRSLLFVQGLDMKAWNLWAAWSTWVRWNASIAWNRWHLSDILQINERPGEMPCVCCLWNWIAKWQAAKWRSTRHVNGQSGTLQFWRMHELNHQQAACKHRFEYHILIHILPICISYVLWRAIVNEIDKGRRDLHSNHWIHHHQSRMNTVQQSKIDWQQWGSKEEHQDDRWDPQIRQQWLCLLRSHHHNLKMCRSQKAKMKTTLCCHQARDEEFLLSKMRTHRLESQVGYKKPAVVASHELYRHHHLGLI